MSSHAHLADQIEDLLPQTQCTQCGYNGCRPYAEAIAQGTAKINQCPPGGQEGITRLATLLGQKPLPLNPHHGTERARTTAVIDPNRCIGCTLCIQACPVDAIVGAAKHMHIVLEDWCTGCNLCVAPCPVDCIDMIVVDTQTGWQAWSASQANAARARHTRHQQRLQQLACANKTNAQSPTDHNPVTPPENSATSESAPLTPQNRKQSLVAQAMARAAMQRTTKS
ncbi:MAG: electron transport complex subunit RsxB [Ottowia sp.]|nr:electron transport complex subunit RsxB [Ottowia sp.]